MTQVPFEPPDPQSNAGAVTSIRPIASQPGWVSVCVGRRRVGAVTGEALERLGIAIGVPWTQARALGFAAEVEYLAALHAGLALLRGADRSSAELARRLEGKGHAAGAVARAVAALEAHPLLTEGGRADRRAGRLASRGVAQSLIEQKLGGEGFTGQAASQAAAEAVRGVDPEVQAERLVRGRLGVRPGSESDPRTWRRLAEVLERNGYEPEVAERVLRRVLGEPPESE